MTPNTLFLLFAPAGQADSRALVTFGVQMALIVGIIYFLMIRPKVQQEKKHREAISQIKKGDEVVSTGGLIGEVVHIKDDRITIKSGESRVVIRRDRVAEIHAGKEAPKES